MSGRRAKLDALLANQQSSLEGRDTSTWAEHERKVLASCHPKQRAFVLDPGRRVAALTSRGCGKTTAGKARLLLRAMKTPAAKCLFVATTRLQAIELMWEPLKATIAKLGIEAKFNETQLRVTLTRNKAQIRCVGMDDTAQLEKLRGIPHHEVGIDESASYPSALLDSLIKRIIGPRLGDYGGCLWMVGTPGHILSGPFYEATRPGSDISRHWDDRHKPEYAGWQSWSLHTWTLRDGAPYVPAMAALWAEALIEKAAQKWADDNPVWLREYCGQWAADDTENVYRYRPHTETGAPWNQWDPERDSRTGLAILPLGEWQFVYGLDLGHSDPMALEVFAFDPQRADRRLFHVYEFEKRGMYARLIAELLLGPELDADAPAGVIGATGWPSGMVADLAGLGGAMLDELSNVYGVTFAEADKKNKHDSIELFNGDLADGRILILKGSRLEEQLQHLQWAVNQFGELREHKGMRNDCTDAAIYARRLAAVQLGGVVGDEPTAAERAQAAPDHVDQDFGKTVGGEFSLLLGDDGGFDESYWG